MLMKPAWFKFSYIYLYLHRHLTFFSLPATIVVGTQKASSPGCNVEWISLCVWQLAMPLTLFGEMNAPSESFVHLTAKSELGCCIMLWVCQVDRSKVSVWWNCCNCLHVVFDVLILVLVRICCTITSCLYYKCESNQIHTPFSSPQN